MSTSFRGAWKIACFLSVSLLHTASLSSFSGHIVRCNLISLPAERLSEQLLSEEVIQVLCYKEVSRDAIALQCKKSVCICVCVRAHPCQHPEQLEWEM